MKKNIENLAFHDSIPTLSAQTNLHIFTSFSLVPYQIVRINWKLAHSRKIFQYPKENHANDETFLHGNALGSHGWKAKRILPRWKSDFLIDRTHAFRALSKAKVRPVESVKFKSNYARTWALCKKWNSIQGNLCGDGQDFMVLMRTKHEM